MSQGVKWVVCSAFVVLLAVIVLKSLPHPGRDSQTPPLAADSATAADSAVGAPPAAAPPIGTWAWPSPPKEKKTLLAEKTPPPAPDPVKTDQASASDDKPSTTQTTDSLKVIPFPETEVSTGAADTKPDSDATAPTGRNSALRALLDRQRKH